MFRYAKISMAVLCLSALSFAEVPQQINHQGVVSVNGERFSGVGSFRFAIIDPDTGFNLWCNDPADADINGIQDCTEVMGAEPPNAVPLTVKDGVYSVLLGDNVNLTNMSRLPSSVFDTPNAHLRIWFDDGVNGNQMLSPDQKLTPAPYAHNTPGMSPIGSIIAWHKNLPGVPGLPDGWLECNGPLASDDPDTPVDETLLPNLNGTRQFLRGSASSGAIEGHATALPTSSNFVTNSTGSHNHSYPTILTCFFGGASGCMQVFRTDVTNTSSRSTTFTPSHNHTISGGDSETRPVNMSVVWIMRVK